MRAGTNRGWARTRRDLRATWIGGCLFWMAWISGPLGATLLFAVFSFLGLREVHHPRAHPSAATTAR